MNHNRPDLSSMDNGYKPGDAVDSSKRNGESQIINAN